METTKVREQRLSFLQWIRKAGASLLFIGYFPYAPGTIGAAITIVALWFVNDKAQFLFAPSNIVWFWVAMFGVIAISTFLSSKSKEIFGVHDAPQIIVDEVAGQFITFFMVPISFHTLVLGFLLFRFFDIVKPYPVFAMEEIEDGLGVVMDDVAAGVMSNISLMVILAAYHWVRAYL